MFLMFNITKLKTHANTDLITVRQKSARNFVGILRTTVLKSTTNITQLA